MIGTYVLRDDLHLATPPPHPSEAPIPLNNPLATTVGPPTAGTKLSITILAPRRPPSQSLFRITTGASTRSGIPPSIQEEAVQSSASESGSVFKSNGTVQSFGPRAPIFGEDNPALQPVVNGKKGNDPSKVRKPKNNIVKSNSSFVSRVIPHEALQRRLNERSPEGVFAFANINRAVQWLDLSSDIKQENLTKILFTKAHALCHDVNSLTKSASHIDVVFGFSTSDIIWYEPMSQKYARLNKNGQINPTPISSIKWLPNSENLFIAAHMDGSLVVYDKEKEDAPFVPEEPNLSENGSVGAPYNDRSLKVKKSVQSRNQKTNPVAYWKVSNQKVNCISFSPDGEYLAIASEDGILRIIDHLNERLLSMFPSYYGGFTTVCWSPDGRYILTGGQDDLVSIWSFADSSLVARCQGHNSWVTDVKFDPWRCDERNYRFGSVGEDCRLLLWDFSVGMLGRPKAHSIRPRGSVSSHLPIARKESHSTVSRLRSNSSLATAEDSAVNGNQELEHAPDSRASTAMLPPVMVSDCKTHGIVTCHGKLTALSVEEDRRASLELVGV